MPPLSAVPPRCRHCRLYRPLGRRWFHQRLPPKKLPSGVAIGLIGVVTCVVLFGLLVRGARIWLMSMR
ncbi:hypothetical protein GDR29_20505 [Xanthomonas oryzae pv. oryzae]|nr:hypothetical protein GDR29_20505 [Xanthomonas oryzae pv. oryzae]